MRRTQAWFTAVLVLCAGIHGFPARAATITVTSKADTVANDGVITLREAILSINAAADQSDVTHSGTYGTSDTINFTIPGGFALINVGFTGNGTLPPIVKPVKI